MGIFFAYILKSAICLSCFYLFYRWLLSKETFHRFNRITLLGILILSFIIPFVEIPVTQQTDVNQVVVAAEQILVKTNLSTPVIDKTVSQPVDVLFLVMQIGIMIYLGGIFFLTCRNIYSLCHIGLLLKSGNWVKMDGHIMLIIHDRDIVPFSWMRFIVISRKDFQENGHEILIHEKAHIRNGHSWDMLLVDICVFLQWFNPITWLLKQEFQNVHEFEADETVLQEGIDAKQYQLLLIKKAAGTRLYSMVSGFNHSNLKKRITMMLKEKSNSWARLKGLYVLPLAVLAMAAFSCNGRTGVASEKVSETTEMGKATSKTITEEVVADTVSSFDPQTFLKKKLKDKKVPLVVMDGQEVNASIVLDLPIKRLRTAVVMKPLQAKKVYGDKAKNGVLLIETFSANQIQVKGVVKDEAGNLLADMCVYLDAAGAAKITNEKGEFIWDAPDNATMTVFGEGYVKQQMKVSENPVVCMKKK